MNESKRQQSTRDKIDFSVQFSVRKVRAREMFCDDREEQSLFLMFLDSSSQ
jgi:hypothetical protein